MLVSKKKRVGKFERRVFMTLQELMGERHSFKLRKNKNKKDLDAVNQQLLDANEASGPGDLAGLLQSGATWVVD